MQQGLDNSILMKLMGKKAQNITIRLAIVFKDKL